MKVDLTETFPNGWACHGDTISQALHECIRGHLAVENPDAVLSIETHLFNLLLSSDTCEYDIDIGKVLFLNKGRWSRLIREYVPREGLQRFVDQAVEILSREARLGATANMLFRDPDRHAKKHRWGGCLMGASFRGDNHKGGPATLTFYSRTTYIGYMGVLDAAIAACIAKEICANYNGSDDDRELSLKNIAFRWYISSSQLHCFKSLPYMYSQPDLCEKLDRYGRNPAALKRATPTWRYCGKWYARMVKKWKDVDEDVEAFLTEKYGPLKRVMRRWLEHKGILTKNVPPKLTIDDLDFSKAE